MVIFSGYRVLKDQKSFTKLVDIEEINRVDLNENINGVYNNDLIVASFF